MIRGKAGAGARGWRVRATAGWVACLMWAFCGASASWGQCFQWAQVSEGGPEARDYSAMDFDARRGVAVLFGGLSAQFEKLGDTWTWDGVEWRLVAETGPTPRSHHAMAYDSARGVIVLFGGSAPYDVGDTWEWDGTRWELKSTEGPAARTAHRLAFDAACGVTVLFGGFQSNCCSHWDDTWEWDGVTWTQVQVSGPVGRAKHAMAYDADRQVIVLFGGSDWFSSRFADTWEWDGAAWTRVATSGPSARVLHSMTWHETRHTVMLFGGTDGSTRGDTWEWNGSAWRLLSTTGPPPRSQHAMTYDGNRDAAVIFGGRDRFNVHLGDTWETTGATLDIVQQPSDQTARGGAPASFTVVAEGRGELTYQWRRNGQSLVDGGTIIGAQTDTLTITRVFRDDAAEYDVKVTGDCGTVTSERATLYVIDPLLSVNATCPSGGPISVSWQYATPLEPVALVFAGNTGRFRVPNGFECAGTQLGLGTQAIQIVWRGNSESDGARTIFSSTGPEACGGYMQLVDLSFCAPSNVAQVE